MNISSKQSGAILVGIVVATARLASGAMYEFTAGGGGFYTASWSGSQAIADGNGSGTAYGLNFGGSPGEIKDITVRFNISGGWNGDLYAYLSHGDQYSVLLNRVGASTPASEGYANQGFNVSLTTGAANPDIHTYQYSGAGQVVGAFQADGRVQYTDANRGNPLDVFKNQNPNGAWTLFFADLSSGHTSTIENWSVELTAVPEPVTCALGIFGAIAGASALIRYRKRTRQSRS
ncbi:MAG TPA: hypothetical protein VN673_17430 [Clostridia bacterium]|nr:hypothetical protein [Clostridia bacterium]